MKTKEAIRLIESELMLAAWGSPATGALQMALDALREREMAEKNDPLTVDELQEMAQHGLAVWCDDTDGIAQGLLFMRESWGDSRISPHICLMDEEGNPDVYHVEYMAELGAKFYRRKPEGKADE